MQWLLRSARLAVLVLLAGAPLWAQRPRDHSEGHQAALPIQPSRRIFFETTEGTRMNVDVSPDGRTIVFDLLGDIYTLPVIGGTARQRTRGLSVDRRPVWSPDGTRIAYVSDANGAENLWVMRADGGEPRPVASERKPIVSSSPHTSINPFRRVEWTADGQYLLSDDTIYHIAGGKQPLTGVPARSPSFIRFSRDGRYVHFMSDGVQRYDQMTGKTVQLAKPPGFVSDPVVSPDGQWVSYITDAPAGGSRNGLWVRSLETGEDRCLAHGVDRANRYVFTPDSRAIVIGYGGKLHRIDVATAEDAIIPFTAQVEIDLGAFVYHRFRLTNDSLTVRYIRSADVSPDGTMVVFSALQQLYTMEVSGRTPHPLVEQNEGQFQPAYSPDGRWIAYVTWRENEGGHVWRVSASGGKPQRLTSVAGYYQRPAWSPDGAMLAVFTADAEVARSGSARDGRLELLPSMGGVSRTILAGVSRVTSISFTGDGQRIVLGDKDALVSIRLDGSDRRVIVRITTRDPESMIGVLSPDGRYVAYSILGDLYLAPLPATSEQPTLGEFANSATAVRLSHGALDPRWDAGGRVLTWVYANYIYRVDPDVVMRAAAAGETKGDLGATRAVRVPHEALPVRLTVPRQVASGTLVLRGGRAITMKGDEVIEDATVVITNDRIAAVGRSSDVPLPKGAKVLDVRGKTLLPGLIDLHAHFAERQPYENFHRHNWSYLINLAYGVTTARELSGTTAQFGDAEIIETGRMLGPRLFTVGPTVSTRRRRPESLDDAREMVQHRKAMGAVVIKQYEQPTRRQRQWVLLAAAEAGLNVTAHNYLDTILDGFTGAEHDWDGVNAYGDLLRLRAESKTWHTGTLSMEASSFFRHRYAELYRDPKYVRFAPQQLIRAHQIGASPDSANTNVIEKARSEARIAHQGGHVTIGSHGDNQGLGAHWEVWTLQKGGLTNHEALMAATIRGAEGLGMQQDLGSIEVGKIADLLVLDENPLDDIEHTSTIRYVMKNGQLYEGATLRTLSPGENE